MIFLSRLNHKSSKSILSIALMLTVIISPLICLINIEPASGAVTVLTTKWTRSGLGTNWEGGVVLGDVTGDGVDDVVYGGNDNLVVLDGITGNTIASYAQTRIGQYCQPQCYDVDGDGILDILVPLYYLPGLAAVKYHGDSTLQQLWIVNTEGSSGSGSVMAKPVAGDIDGDGKLDIFIASQDVSPGGFYDANGLWNAPNGYDGTVCRINATNGQIIAQTFTWRPCSGGLSLADTDNDGVFELYQGDRGIYYGDGNYGAGERSWWAENLTIRWNRYDALTSSQAPALVDVNGDGILDVISGMYSEMSILNSSNGQWLNHLTSTGAESPPRGTMSVHYGITVYDIDADGHQELLCSDGDHDDNNNTDVYDLVTGQLKAQLYLGNFNSTQPYDNKWSPLVADIYPNGNNPDGSPRMEIITGANTSRTTTYTSYPACLLIFDNQYNLLQNITGLSNQIGYPIVQDIDNDGLLELIAIQNNGVVRAYDTSSPEPTQRIRSEVTYFGEKRTGAAVYQPAPWAPNYWTAPLVTAITPGDNSLAAPITTTQLTFKLREHQSEALTYTVTTSPNIGSLSGSINSGTYNWNTINVPISGLAYDTTYKWTVTASDGSQSTSRTYTFRTVLAPNAGNSVPTQGDPKLVSQDGLNTTSSTFTATNQTTNDVNAGDKVTNAYLWSVDGQPVANLVLPFNTRGETTTKDYSGYNNNGAITGAAWTPNGKVGGAYSFDGKDDAIVISDGGAGYYDNKTYSTYNPELGGDGTWLEVSGSAWINLANYNNGSRIIAKLPSYELGFTSNFNGGASTTLMASVWPHTGAIGTDDNHAAADRASTVSANVNLALNTWYHIAFTYESGVGLKLYLNGVMVAQRAGVTGVLEVSSGAPVYIGRLVQPFAGLIDEVQIYPYTLSAANINSYYQATKDGLSANSSFCPEGIAAPGDILTCTVIPSDSYGDGVARSASITLANSAPNATDLKISPIRSGNARLDEETLGAYYIYTDPDGQLESGSQIRWYMNGTLQTGLNNSLSVPATTTQIGQTWFFTVTPKDTGNASGPMQTSPTVTIRGNIAPVTGTPILDSTNGNPAYDDEELTATAAATTDANNDQTTNIYHWTKNGASQTNLQMPFDTEIPTVSNTNGAAKDYSGYNNNGIVNGSTWKQDGVVGGAMSFDGNDYITVQENSNSLGGDGTWSTISVEFWAQASGATSTQTVVFKPDSTYAPGVSSYGLGYRVQYRSYANGYRVYWVVGNSTAQISLNSQINEGPGEWHHVVCTYQSGVGLKIYTDGLLRATLAGIGNINATSGGRLYLGGVNSGVGDFVGQMDEVRIYRNVLSASQVFQRYVDTYDGVSNSETIAPQETSIGDTWRCEVTPNDVWGDGTTMNSQTLTIVSGNTQPNIDWYSPTNTTLTALLNDTIAFKQNSSGTGLTYSWTLDSIEQATTQNWNYTPTSTGIHHVKIAVTAGALNDSQEWTINVSPNGPLTNYSLSILPSSNGNTNPIAGDYQHQQGSQVSIQAIPNANYIFANWLLNNTNVGSTNPYLLTMDANYTLTAVFSEAPKYNLHVQTSGSGTTNATGDALYYNGTAVSIQATASNGWVFSHWLRNGTNIGSTNPLPQIVDANYNVTAVFSETPPQYNLHVEVSGSGTTNATGDALYTSGTAVAIQATANTGSTFSHWLRNGTNIGSTNPYLQTMDANYAFTAVFIQQEYTLTINIVGDGSVTKNPDQVTYHYGDIVQLTADPDNGWQFAGWSGDLTGPDLVKTITLTGNKTVTATFTLPPSHIFDDGFESGTFSAWSSQTRTTGETTTVVSNIANTGSYSAMFTSDGGLSYERAYTSRSGLSLSEIYTRAYVYVDQSGIVDNADRFYFIQIVAGSNVVAYGGWRQDSSGNLHWHLMTRDGTNYVGVYSTTTPATDTWYCMELHWKSDATAGLGELFVNGELVASITDRNTANYGSATNVRAGLPEIYNCAATTAYIDDVAIDDSYIGPIGSVEPDYVYLTITSATDGSTNPIAGVYQYEKNNAASITATANSGYLLSGWLLDGTPVAADNPYSLTMDENHTLTPVFAAIPQPTYYDLTVQVSGSGSTNATGTVSYLEDSTVTVLATPDANYELTGWLLDGVPVAADNPYTLTMDENHTLTAVFEAIPQPVYYDLTVAVSGSGSTNATGKVSYLEGSSVTVQATPDTDYVLSHWLLNGTNVGSTNPYVISMDANYELTAVFTPKPDSVFSDGFETGDFSAWSSTSATSGESASIVTSPVYSGANAASFTSNGGGGYEKTYAIETLSPSLGTVSVEGTFMLSQNGIVESGDRIKLIELRSGSTVIAAAGLRQRTAGLSYWLETRDGTTYVESYAQSTTDVSQWFTMELQWTNDVTNGGGSLLVNGVSVIEVTGDNTSNYGDCSEVRVGLTEAYNCGSTTLNVDTVTIDSADS